MTLLRTHQWFFARPAAMLLLLTLLANAKSGQAADLELLCPCAIDSSGPTSMNITAGVRNVSTGGSSGSLRLQVRASATIDGSYYTVGHVYLPDTLAGGAQYPIASFQTGYSPPPEGAFYYTLALQEYTGSGWTRVDKIRMRQRARSIQNAGRAYGSGAVFFDGRAAASIDGGQITLTLPAIKNVSASSASGDLSVQIRQKNSGNSYYLRNTIPLNTSLPALTEMDAQTLPPVSYSEVNAPGFDYFDILLVGAGSQLASHRLYVNTGELEQRYFALDSVDVLGDDDNDLVSNYNEGLTGTDAGNASDKPPKAVVRLLVYHSDELSGDPVTRIDHLLSYSNQVLADSGADVILELAKAEQIDLPAAIGNDVILDNMNGGLDIFAGLSTTRKTELADFVMVLQPYQNDGNCGIASLGGIGDKGDFSSPNDAARANAVVSDGNNCGDSTTIHELGHVLGLSHSRRQDSGGTFDWSTGHGVDGGFVTIMPYASFFPGASEVGYFSTPLIDCEAGIPCGVDRSNLASGADAAFSINTVSHQVAAYTRDTDGDGTANALDDDDDGDGTPDVADEMPLDPNDVSDFDLDGIGDSSDTDDDDDGLTDAQEGVLGTNSLSWDTDSDGVKDDSDAFPNSVAASLDADQDGLPDAWNAVCNLACQAGSGLILDDEPASEDCPDYECRPFYRGWRAAIFKQ